MSEVPSLLTRVRRLSVSAAQKLSPKKGNGTKKKKKKKAKKAKTMTSAASKKKTMTSVKLTPTQEWQAKKMAAAAGDVMDEDALQKAAKKAKRSKKKKKTRELSTTHQWPPVPMAGEDGPVDVAERREGFVDGDSKQERKRRTHSQRPSVVAVSAAKHASHGKMAWANRGKPGDDLPPRRRDVSRRASWEKGSPRGKGESLNDVLNRHPSLAHCITEDDESADQMMTNLPFARDERRMSVQDVDEAAHHPDERSNGTLYSEAQWAEVQARALGATAEEIAAATEGQPRAEIATAAEPARAAEDNESVHATMNFVNVNSSVPSSVAIKFERVEGTGGESGLRNLAARLFRALDEDSDGRISTEEASKLFDADDWDGILSGADEDSDGFVDVAEWVDYVVAMGREEGYDDAISSFTEMLNAVILPSAVEVEKEAAVLARAQAKANAEAEAAAAAAAWALAAEAAAAAEALVAETRVKAAAERDTEARRQRESLRAAAAATAEYREMLRAAAEATATAERGGQLLRERLAEEVQTARALRTALEESEERARSREVWWHDSIRAQQDRLDRAAKQSLKTSITLGRTAEEIDVERSRTNALTSQLVALRSDVCNAVARSTAADPAYYRTSATMDLDSEGLGAVVAASAAEVDIHHRGDSASSSKRGGGLEGRLAYTPPSSLALAALSSQNALCAIELEAVRAAVRLQQQGAELKQQLDEARRMLARSRKMAEEERLCPSGLDAASRVQYYRVQWDESVENLMRRFPALSRFECSSTLTECDSNAADATAKLEALCLAPTQLTPSPVGALRRVRWIAVGTSGDSGVVTALELREVEESAASCFEALVKEEHASLRVGGARDVSHPRE